MSAGQILLEPHKLAKVMDFIKGLAIIPDHSDFEFEDSGPDVEDSGSDVEDSGSDHSANISEAEDLDVRQRDGGSGHQEITRNETDAMVIYKETNNLGMFTDPDVPGPFWQEDFVSTHQDDFMRPAGEGAPVIAADATLYPSGLANETIPQNGGETMHAYRSTFPDMRATIAVQAGVHEQVEKVTNPRLGPPGHVSFRDAVPYPAHGDLREVGDPHVAREADWSTGTFRAIEPPSGSRATSDEGSSRPKSDGVGAKISKSGKAQGRILRGLFIKLFREHGISLGNSDKPQLPWKKYGTRA
ncbi:hypothetical protein DFH09DRAFT_1172516 [Mycena vulgaris]|nr:hypothetical protein DFH09DRAFT_1172516 [Mycena vulgaris]